MPVITLIEGVTMALAYELEHDEDVYLLGEDIGINGGVFRTTDGLQSKFGQSRVIDTPLAESMIAGISVGMATQGLKPVASLVLSIRHWIKLLLKQPECVIVLVVV